MRRLDSLSTVRCSTTLMRPDHPSHLVPQITIIRSPLIGLEGAKPSHFTGKCLRTMANAAVAPRRDAQRVSHISHGHDSGCTGLAIGPLMANRLNPMQWRIPYQGELHWSLCDPRSVSFPIHLHGIPPWFLFPLLRLFQRHHELFELHKAMSSASL